MSYPTLEQYNEALQFPQQALQDSELAAGKVRQTGLDLPLAVCGGFALTYTVTVAGNKYAVRCFHRQSTALEQRYIAIARTIESLQSRFFVDFSFQKAGILVRGQKYPVVKMAWAQGETLGEFLEREHSNAINLANLRDALKDLSVFLEQKGIAHGDIQPGNVMVSKGGRSLQLIDYDGMFVPELLSIGSAETGHRNFQHPGRTAGTWSNRLDRFSFISLDFALAALIGDASLWSTTHSDGDRVLFTASDFADPFNSDILQQLERNSKTSQEAERFMRVCAAAVEKTPDLMSFRAGQNIPVINRPAAAPAKKAVASYNPGHPVISSGDYGTAKRLVGSRVEVIGQVHSVKSGNRKNGTPYIFVNFGDWRGKIFKIAIWHDGLAAMTLKPNDSWVNKWVSIVGLMEPEYTNKKFGYYHLSISVTQNNQMKVLTEAEAKLRLSAKGTSASSNHAVIANLQGPSRTGSRSPSRVASSAPPSTPPKSRNQQIASQMASKASPAPPPRSPSNSPRNSQSSPPPATPGCCLSALFFLSLVSFSLVLVLGM